MRSEGERAKSSEQMKEAAAATPRAKPSTSVGIDAKERHKLGERERRKEMRELVLSLHSLLPHSNLVKKEQSSVLSELIKYLPLASARLQSLQEQRDSVRSAMTTDPVVFKETSLDSGDSDIRIMAELSSSVSIRVRGDRVTVSLSYAQGTSKTLSLSAALDELEAHQLQLIRATHCHDGSKMLLHYESKICNGLEKFPSLLKERLEELSCKLQNLKKSKKRSFHQLDGSDQPLISHAHLH